MITDLIHMTWVTDVLSNDVFMLFLALLPVFLFGIFCGMESWYVCVCHQGNAGSLTEYWIYC